MLSCSRSLGRLRLGLHAVPAQAQQALFHCTESHSDFKSEAVAGTPANVMDAIKHDVESNKVMLYMKGYPSQPMCGFSSRVVALLNAYDVEFESRNVLDDDELRQAIKEFQGWPTVPQLYVKGELVGGCDILWEAHEKGEFEKLVKPQ